MTDILLRPSQGVYPAVLPTNIVVDSVGTIDGTLVGMDDITSWSADIPAVFNSPETSLFFNGINAYVSLPDFPYATTTLTVLLWVKMGGSNGKCIAGHFDAATQCSWLIRNSVFSINKNELEVRISANGTVNA